MNIQNAPSADVIRSLARTMNHHRDTMIQDLVALCAIPSVAGESTDEAPYGRETALALDWFLNRAQSMGFRTVNLDNRAGFVEFGSGTRLVAALCHLDVVPSGDGWQTGPFDPVVTDDRIIARGTADDKGPAIAVLHAMKDLMDSGYQPNGRIRLIVGLDEEHGSSCMAHYVRVAELPDAGFTPDASFPVIYAEKGLCWFQIIMPASQSADDALRLAGASGGTSPNMIPGHCELSFIKQDQTRTTEAVAGVIGHASTPWNGRNAISQAMALAARRLQENKSQHPFVSFYQQSIGAGWRGEGLAIDCSDASGPLTFNAGRLELDEKQATLTVDIRYPVTASFESIWETLQQRVRPWQASLKLMSHIPPLHVPRDSFLVQTLTDVYASLTGHQAEPVAIGGGTYARTMPNVVAFGSAFPGEPDTVHQADEFIQIDHWLASSAIYREALKRLSE